IDAYLDALGEAAYSSVGAYQIEGLGAQLLARIEGDHFSIQGLPLLEVLEFLRMQGVLLP
ncbi:MAG: Maf family protein, partial [Nitrospirota bacterium]|nr:Maf family protein [Nitrospirota bacterium]